ncbi:enoyl-CoA hydratase/isomerase family protein [Geobacter pickeringii]|uniref:Enoyl-CoA hydratase n=1 Tax=Geobacter pickeringii TaxID=345632 RepID=A0A0B5BE00_9BACT|nr:enoyl-CoA hydratase/isomerase family protein [Geobacter pickeringii]AJE04712.1 enoyl-CoA hydratase [Geobacter pickeringii]
MTDKTILTDIDERGIATLTMNRPELHNAFDDALIATLTGELRRLESDDAVRVVVLAAAGRSFSAGADLSWMRRMADYTREENLADALGLAELMGTLATLKKPTIAAVQGAAYGGGVGLVACCDIAIASRRATFCLSEVKLGLIPAVISPYVVEAIGPRAARRYFQSAESFGGDEAHRLGLVHEVTAEEELSGAVERLAAGLLANGPRAMAAAKELVARVAAGPVDGAMIRDTAERIAATRASDEGKEGLSAFLEKRKPAWVKG